MGLTPGAFWFRTHRKQRAYAWLKSQRQQGEEYWLNSKYHLLLLASQRRLISTCGTLVIHPDSAQVSRLGIERMPRDACGSCWRVWRELARSEDPLP